VKHNKDLALEEEKETITNYAKPKIVKKRMYDQVFPEPQRGTPG